MSLEPWEHLGEERLVHFKAFDVIRANRRSPRTGSEHGMFVIDTLGWVQVVATTADDELIMVRQYRQGSEAMSLEIPGGVVSSGETDPAETAARELREETGYQAGSLVSLGSVSPNPALFRNRLHTFVATECVRVGELIQDQGEDLEVVLVPGAELDDLVRSGAIDSAQVLAGICRWRAMRT